MVDETILITVKTYPTLSKSYVETVCTAGINDQGEWRRLYPIRFRYLADDKQFKIFSRITTRLSDHSKDGRPESRRPNADTIQIKGLIKSWSLRHQWVGPTIMDSMEEMVSKNRSIGPVKCQEVIDFYWKDGNGVEHDSMFISWEVCQTWRRYRRNYPDPLRVMKDKWLSDILSEDRSLAFFMGNQARFRHTFMVCGTYNPPKREIENHESLF